MVPSGVMKVIRPECLAKDYTPKLDVIRHAHWYVECEHGIEYDPIIDLDVTNPLRRLVDMDNAYQLFIDNMPDTLFSVTPARRNPYFNMVEGANGYARIAKPKFIDVYRRQDAPTVWDVNCCIYIYSRKWLVKEKNRFAVTDNSMFYEMPPWSFLDTDTLLDFELTEYLMEKYYDEIQGAA